MFLGYNTQTQRAVLGGNRGVSRALVGAPTQRAATMQSRAPLSRGEGSRGTYSGNRGSVGVRDAFDEFSGDEYARSLYTQLAKIPVVGDGIERMSKPEKERRLKIARNAIKIIQEGFRNWVKMFRTERERWKVTSRRYLSYTSVRTG